MSKPRLGWRGTVYSSRARRDRTGLWVALIAAGLVLILAAAIVLSVLFAMELPAH